MNQDECRQYLKEVLDGTRVPKPAPVMGPHERFAAFVQILGVYEQVLYYALCRVQSRGKAKTAPLSLTMVEHQQILETLDLPRAQTPSFWETLKGLETAGFIKVHRRSNRVKLTDWGLPFEDMLAHLSGLDYAAELARRMGPEPAPRR